MMVNNHLLQDEPEPGLGQVVGNHLLEARQALLGRDHGSQDVVLGKYLQYCGAVTGNIL